MRMKSKRLLTTATQHFTPAVVIIKTLIKVDPSRATIQNKRVEMFLKVRHTEIKKDVEIDVTNKHTNKHTKQKICLTYINTHLTDNPLCYDRYYLSINFTSLLLHIIRVKCSTTCILQVLFVFNFTKLIQHFILYASLQYILTNLVKSFTYTHSSSKVQQYKLNSCL